MIFQRHLCGWQDRRGLAEFMFEVPKNGRVSQVASTGGSQLPGNDVTRKIIQHRGEVVPTPTLDLEVGEIYLQ